MPWKIEWYWPCSNFWKILRHFFCELVITKSDFKANKFWGFFHISPPLIIRFESCNVCVCTCKWYRMWKWVNLSLCKNVLGKTYYQLGTKSPDIIKRTLAHSKVHQCNTNCTRNGGRTVIYTRWGVGCTLKQQVLRASTCRMNTSTLQFCMILIEFVFAGSQCVRISDLLL